MTVGLERPILILLDQFQKEHARILEKLKILAKQKSSKSLTSPQITPTKHTELIIDTKTIPVLNLMNEKDEGMKNISIEPVAKLQEVPNQQITMINLQPQDKPTHVPETLDLEELYKGFYLSLLYSP